MRPIYILAAILIFGILIALHELGHFLTAKACGVRVNEFSVGMGPCLWSRTKGETRYSLRAFPLGGYCALEGEDGDTGDERSFTRQSFKKKVLILSAGSAMNFLTGLLIIFVLFAGATAFFTDQVVGLAPEFALSGENGIQEGDLIYKVNGYRTYMSGDASLFLSYSEDFADIEVVRDGERIRIENVPRREYTGTEGETYQGFGIYVGRYPVEATAGTVLKYTLYQGLDFVQQVWFSLQQLVRGNAGLDDVSGPVGIVSTISDVGMSAPSAGLAWSNIFFFAALIAVNLSVMNMLPVPALDGGRIFFLILDGLVYFVSRKRIPEKYMVAVTTACFVLLIGFMLLVTVHDISRLVS